MTDPVLEALWKQVLHDWDDDAVHAVFIEHCRQNRNLLEAAVRYRGMAGDHARGPIAEKRLQGISVLAMTQLESERAPAPLSVNALTVVRIVMILLFIAGSIALLFARGR